MRIAHWALGSLFVIAALVVAVFFSTYASAQIPDVTTVGQESDEGKGDQEATPAPSTQSTDVEVEKMDSEKLEAYEDNLNRIRERIFRSKSRLMQLYEQLKLGSVSIVGISIDHTHEVGSTFKLEQLTYTLDGFEVYEAVNDTENSLEKLKGASVYEGSLLPGEHMLVVDMVFRGKGYGVFSYLNQYLFKVKSRYTFTVEEGDVVQLHVTSFDKGSFLTPLKDRLKVKFERE